MKLRNNKWFILLILIIVVIVCIFYNKPVKGNEYWESSSDKIVLNVADSDISFVQKTKVGDNIEYNLDGLGPDKMKIKENNGTLTITVEIPKRMNLSNQKLVVSVPKGFDFSSVSINAASSDIKIPNISTDNISLINASGDINVSNLTAKTINIKVASGDVQLSLMNPFETCKIITLSGDINGTFDFPVKIKATSMSGDINSKSNDDSQYSLEATTVSGDININSRN